MTNNVSRLLQKRETIKNKLQSFKNLLDERQNEPDIYVLKAHMGRLETAFAKLEETTSELNELDISYRITGDENRHDSQQATMETDYVNVLARFYKLQDKATQATAAAAAASSCSSIQALPNSSSSAFTPARLSELSFPKFTGRYEDWISFQDDFQSAIGKRPDLSDTERLTYLRSCLSGEPERLVRQFQTTDEGYQSAWKLLTKTFGNTGRIRESHIAAILNVSTMQTESAQDLRELINTIELHCAALESLGENTFSTMMLYIALTKVDKSTRKLWRLSLKEDELPTYEQFITFLRWVVKSLDDPFDTSKV